MPQPVDSTRAATTVSGRRSWRGARAKACAGLVRAGEQCVDGERGRGAGVEQPVHGGPLVLAQRVQEAGVGEGAQQGVAQDVGATSS
ncbi:hypothetical protein ABZ656_16410 [Streptomyces sp. NPDC007095]|uniref:hypothetical protein n=1 Tax=Streptomyces sp. NPDC007095 TaxID=3154482 RepID=UPI0015D5EC8D